MRKLIYLLILGGFLMTACQKDKDDNTDQDTNSVENMEDLVIDDDFDYNTSTHATFNITVRGNTDFPMPGVKLNVYNGDPEKDGKKLFTGFTNSNGKMITNHPIPDYLENVYIQSPFIGVPNLVKVPVKNGSVNFTYGDNLQQPKKDMQ